MASLGEHMYALCAELFPICRSITGEGFRRSLAILRRHLPEMQVREVPTGTPCFDWRVPREWTIRDAYIITPDGSKICDFQRCNLHLLGYSTPVDTTLSLAELQEHLYSLPDQPDAIPYFTSYYREAWGFCIAQRDRDQLTEGDYRVCIDSDLTDGSLTYGELILPGDSDREIFLSTYMCHPSMANNELSGPVVVTHLARWLADLPERRYTYRIIIIPETIGSLTYLSRHYQTMQERVLAGFNITCVGDDRDYSYVASRRGNTPADAVARHVLGHLAPQHSAYDFRERSSDERQYCSPGIDLPVCLLARSKCGNYPEYHTSLDNLDLISPAGLLGGYTMVQRCLQCLEADETLRATVLGEPQLGRRGLYPTLGTRQGGRVVRAMMDLLAYADGENSLLDIATIIGVPLWELRPTADQLLAEGLLARVH